MTTPVAFGRHVAAPGDTVKGNVKVVEFGLFGGSDCASPAAGASTSAVAQRCCCELHGNPPVVVNVPTPDAVLPLARAGPEYTPPIRSAVICGGLFIFVIVIKQAAWEPEQFLALRSRHILLPRAESPHPSSVRFRSFWGCGLQGV